MNEYKKPYYILFNACTDALAALEEQDFGRAGRLLRRAQADAEEASWRPGRRTAEKRLDGGANL